MGRGDIQHGLRTKTNIQYELPSNGLIVNKTSKAFYITNQHQILKVENPKNLRPCSKEYYYENAKKTNVLRT